MLLQALVASTSLSFIPDAIIWRWNSNGIFTIKSAYYFLCFDGVDDRIITYLWGWRIPLKIRIFLWLALRHKLLTGDRLIIRWWVGPSFCSLCNASEETLDHLLLVCPYAKAVWSGALHNWPAVCYRFLNSPEDLASRWRVAHSSSPGRLKNVFDSLFAAVCWEIWSERNRRIFDDILISRDRCVLKVLNTVKSWNLAYLK